MSSTTELLDNITLLILDLEDDTTYEERHAFLTKCSQMDSTTLAEMQDRLLRSSPSQIREIVTTAV